MTMNMTADGLKIRRNMTLLEAQNVARQLGGGEVWCTRGNYCHCFVNCRGAIHYRWNVDTNKFFDGKNYTVFPANRMSMDTLEDTPWAEQVKDLTLTVDVEPDTDKTVALEQMAILADRLGIPVEADFNGSIIGYDPSND